MMQHFSEESWIFLALSAVIHWHTFDKLANFMKTENGIFKENNM